MLTIIFSSKHSTGGQVKNSLVYLQWTSDGPNGWWFIDQAESKQVTDTSVQQWAHLVQVGVSDDVVAPLLGAHAVLAVRPRVADPHSLERGRQSPGRVTRGAGEDPHPARCRAPAQRQGGSSWERVHAACRQPGSKTTTHTQYSPAAGSGHLKSKDTGARHDRQTQNSREH